MKGQTEIWKSHPDILGIEVSTFGRVRTLDRVVSSENGTRFTKGRILKQHENNRGYLLLKILVGEKWVTKSAHRLAAQTFITNPDSLTEVNHKNCDRHDNRVSNLEWCSHSYNIKYRDKFGKSTGRPVFVINLTTLKVSKYPSQSQASIALGINSGSVNAVISGRTKQAHGYWFVNADDKAVDLTKQKLREIGKTRLTAADSASADFVSKIISE